jgi:hypothetical protein
MIVLIAEGGSPMVFNSTPAADRRGHAEGHIPLFAAQALFFQLPEREETPQVERVLRAFETHENAEEDAIATYKTMATADDPVMALLMGLVAEDEDRHHRLIERIEQRLRDDIHWTRTPDALPSGADHSHVDATSFSVEQVKALADAERSGVEHLRKLGREVTSLHDGLLALLLEMMALDSEKHERVLRYLAKRIERSR